MVLGKRTSSGKVKIYRKMKKARARRRFMSRTLRRSVRAAVLSNSETKFNVSSFENAQLYHNSGIQIGGTNYLTYFSNLLSTTVGNTQNTRLGDSVYGRYLSVKLWLSNKSDRPNVMYRVALISCPPDQLVGNPTGLFKGESPNKMLDSIDTDRYKILYHKMIKPFSGDYSLESGAANKEHSTFLKMRLPLKNKLIKYSTNSGSTPSYQNDCISLMVIAYDAYGTLVTDNIASVAGIYKFYYKDP